MKRLIFLLFMFCSLATYANEQDSIVTDDGYVINLKDQTFSKDGEDIDVIRVELVNYSEDVKVTLVDVFEDFLLELRCSNEYFVCPGYYKIEIVNSSPHIRVRLVENFEDIRIAIK